MSGWRVQIQLLCAALACAGRPCQGFAQTRIDVIEAQRYVEYCAGCHGADGKGGDKAVSLATSRSLMDKTDAQLFQIVHDGTGDGMPPFAQIGDANIRSLVRYLRVLEGEPGPAGAARESGPSGDPRAGRSLYFGKVRCSACHLVDGSGGFIGADLTRYGRYRTADAILRAIVTPDDPLIPTSRIVTITTKAGKILTGALRNEDNFNIAIQSEDGRYHLLPRNEVTQVQYTEHSLMPGDYGSQLTPKELDDIASFLILASRSPRPGLEQQP